MHLPDASASPSIVVALSGPLTTDAIVDAHLRARREGRRVTLVHEGAASAVALRAAARFGVALVGRAPPSPAGPDFPAPPMGSLRALERARPAPFWGVVADAAFDPPVFVEAASAPAAEVAHAGPELPWDPTTRMPEPAAVEVDPDEVAAMPWSPAYHHELLPAGRSTRAAPPRPSLTPDWGLPWPRPVPPSGGLAIADPAVWHARERVHALREDLDRAGAPSFGAVKPEGSAWLKRLSEFGSP